MTIHHGDCLDVMATLPEASVDAIVTDPPYGLEFMGKEWDKLGERGRHKGTERKGMLDEMGFKGFRTMPNFGNQTKNPKCRKCSRYKWDHVTRKCVCEPPDFENRHMGNEQQAFHSQWAAAALRVAKPGAYLLAFGGTRTVHRMTVALEDAGWIIRDMLVWAYASGFPKSRALLKPAWEPIVMARKPGPLRELDIDGCRIGTSKDVPASLSNGGSIEYGGNWKPREWQEGQDPNIGRWPANMVLTDPIFDGGIEGVVGGGEVAGEVHNQRASSIFGTSMGMERATAGMRDTGTYSRFFLIPKASRSDREPVLPGMLEERDHGAYNGGAGMPGRTLVDGEWVNTDTPRKRRVNTHATVKPIELMRHLVRLVTPAVVGTLSCDGCGTVLEYEYDTPVLSPTPCQQCGGPIVTDHVKRTRFCGRPCAATHTARNRSNYRGWYRDPKGYILVRAKDHPMASREGYVMQHRLVMAEQLGRMLEPGEVVDHINGVKDDNRPENLRVLSKRDHDSLPKPPKRPIVCPHCNWTILISGRVQRVEGALPPEPVQAVS